MNRRAFLAASAALPVTGAVAAGLPAETGDETLLRLGDELDRAWAREKALIYDDGKCGNGYDATYDVSSAIVDQIEKQQAHTLEGLRVKARAVMWCQQWGKFEPFSLGEQQTTDIRLSEAIIRDLVGVSIA